MYPVYKKHYSKQLTIIWLVIWQVTIVYWITLAITLCQGKMLALIQWPAFTEYLLSALCVSLRRDIIVTTVSQADPWAVFL